MGTLKVIDFDTVVWGPLRLCILIRLYGDL